MLWYLILMPFAKLGFPYITTNIISWIITSISVLLILKKAPFKFYKRVLLIFSFPFLYLFPIVSRCYCLIPLAIVLMCIFYKDRKQKPFRYLISVIILANTHIIMLGMSGIVFLDYILEFINDWKKILKEEKIKRLISFIIAITLLIISILPLMGCLTTNKDVGNDSNAVLKILYAIFYYPFILIMQLYNVFMADTTIITILVSAIIILLFYEIKNSPLNYLKVLICILWQCIIYSFIYSSSLQRASTIILILLYFKWIDTYKESKTVKKIEKKVVNICWIILMIINILGGVLYILFYEIKYNCSNAYEIGNYINAYIDDNSIILSGPRIEFTSSIIPYVDKNIKFYHIQGNRFFSYSIWDNQNKIGLCMKDIENLTNFFNKEQKLYYIYCNSKSDGGEDIAEIDENNLINECIEKGIFKEIYSANKTSIYLENYIMYEIILSNLQ